MNVWHKARRVVGYQRLQWDYIRNDKTVSNPRCIRYPTEQNVPGNQGCVTRDARMKAMCKFVKEKVKYEPGEI